MIGILKYRAGNTASVSNALERLGAEHIITDSTEQLDRCDAVIFPGVGHAASAMEDLRAKQLDRWLRQTARPVLGICLGMQLFYESTEEGDCRTLGILPGRLRKFPAGSEKVPHMGWNRFTSSEDHPLLRNLGTGTHFYYVHSFHAPVNEYTIATCRHICDFAAAAARDNYFGVQFHPEKSGPEGAALLGNFLEYVREQTIRNPINH